MVTRKKASGVEFQKRKAHGLLMLGNDREKIASVMDITVSKVKILLGEIEVKPVKKRTKKQVEDPLDIEKNLVLLGQEKMNAIIQERARQVREFGRCLD